MPTDRSSACLRPRPGPATLLALAVTLTALLARPAPATAAGLLERRFGSDDANLANAQTFAKLLGPDSHFDARLGAWYANLSRGPFSNVDASIGEDVYEGSSTGINPEGAAGRIRTGSGLLRDIGLSLGVRGNEAFFDYVSDQLFEAMNAEVDARTRPGYARETIKMLMGEFRPNLKDWLGVDARVFIQTQYGRLTGRIDDMSVFTARNAQPYFGPRKGGSWDTRLFSLEAGWFHEDDAYTSTKKDEGTRLGGYLRYLSFSMPTVVGQEELDRNYNALQDADFAAIGVGFRGEYWACPNVCLETSMSFVPIGAGSLDLGRWGELFGSPLQLGADVGVNYPWVLGSIMTLRPYLTFRADWFTIWGAQTGGEGNFATKTVIPDYFLWGPRAGLSVSL
jgi:hypothetical protein